MISTSREQLYQNIQNGPLKLPNFLSDSSRNLIIQVSPNHHFLQLLNRNPTKRLGSGKSGADEIKAHPFFDGLNWSDALQRKLAVPKPYTKKVIKQDLALEKLFGRGAFDESMKGQNRLNDWSFVQH